MPTLAASLVAEYEYARNPYIAAAAVRPTGQPSVWTRAALRDPWRADNKRHSVPSSQHGNSALSGPASLAHGQRGAAVSSPLVANRANRHARHPLFSRARHLAISFHLMPSRRAPRPRRRPIERISRRRRGVVPFDPLCHTRRRSGAERSTPSTGSFRERGLARAVEDAFWSSRRRHRLSSRRQQLAAGCPQKRQGTDRPGTTVALEDDLRGRGGGVPVCSRRRGRRVTGNGRVDRVTTGRACRARRERRRPSGRDSLENCGARAHVYVSCRVHGTAGWPCSASVTVGPAAKP